MTGFVKMLKFFVFGVLVMCCGGFELKITGETEDEVHQDLLLREPMLPDLNEFGSEIQRTYYTTPLKPKQFNPLIVEVDEELRHRSSEEENSSEEQPKPPPFPPPDSSEHGEDEEPTFQPWSILWYVGSFGGLIAFFLVVSCSEWCCRNRNRDNARASSNCSPTPSENPPPEYDLFAPPSYDSLCAPPGEKSSDYDVYVVPVHGQMVNLEPTAPPDYYEVTEGSYRGGERNPPSSVVVNVSNLREESSKVQA